MHPIAQIAPLLSVETRLLELMQDTPDTPNFAVFTARQHSLHSAVLATGNLSVCLKFAVKLTVKKIESWGYPRMKTACSLSRFDRLGLPACDGHGRTDGFTIGLASTAFCIASKLR